MKRKPPLACVSTLFIEIKGRTPKNKTFKQEMQGRDGADMRGVCPVVRRVCYLRKSKEGYNRYGTERRETTSGGSFAGPSLDFYREREAAPWITTTSSNYLT